MVADQDPIMKHDHNETRGIIAILGRTQGQSQHAAVAGSAYRRDLHVPDASGDSARSPGELPKVRHGSRAADA